MVFPRLLPAPLRLARLVALAVFVCAALPVTSVPGSARIEQADADNTDAEAEAASPDAGRPSRPAQHAPRAAVVGLVYPVAPPGPNPPAAPPVISAARLLPLRC